MEGHMHPEIESRDKKMQEAIEAIKQLDSTLKKIFDFAITFDEACEYLKYARSYLYKLCCFKSFPHHKPGGKVLYFFRSEIDGWIRNLPNGRP